MHYRDCYRVSAEGKKLKWIRKTEQEAMAWVAAAKGAKSQHIFVSIQRFLSPEKSEGEEHLSDLWFDFDGVGAQEDCLKVADYFLSLGLNDSDFHIWFSGKKGFHLRIPSQYFNARVSPVLHRYWRIIAGDIKKQTSAETLDITLYSKRRQIRVENTLHGGGERYKIPLELEQLKVLSMGEIKRLAESEVVSHHEALDEKPIPVLAKLLLLAKTTYETTQSDSNWEASDIKFENNPPCIETIMQQGVLELGSFNKTAFRLAAYFKTQEVQKGDTFQLMRTWVLNVPAAMTHELLDNGAVDYESLHKQTYDITNSVYANDQYGFSCQGIKQLEGIEELCTDECRAITEVRVEVSLFDARMAENLGKRLYIKAEAVGRRDEGYIVPKDIHIKCTDPTGSDKCAGCALYPHPEGMVIKLTAKQKNILQFLEPSPRPLTSKIAIMCGIPEKKTCSKWVWTAKNQNVEIIYLSPRVTNEYELEDRHTRVSAFYFGHGLEPNTGYEFSGYIHVNPMKNLTKLVLDTAEPLEDTITMFKFTEEMQKVSMVFRPASGQSYEDKHSKIVAALNYKILHLWGRDDMIKAMDIAYHSVRKFYFQQELINGWIDCLIIGDSGQGKTKAAEGLMEYYNLGIRISGESAGRTGLLYTIPVRESEPAYVVWGILPRHTGRLVFIDELKELVKTGGFAELTEARSAGQVTVARTAFGKAMCETRLVMMTNTVGRKVMGSYNYPCMALLDLIPDREDIRRCTYAIGVSSGQIDDAVINVDLDTVAPIAEQYDSQVCHDHLLWVWSLPPDKVIISHDVEKAILSLSLYMCQRYIPMIPLVEPGDFRLKLARVACAVAARMDSRDGGNLIVTEAAVDYARDFMDSLYSDSTLNYLGYSKAFAEYALDDDTADRLAGEFKLSFEKWRAIGKWIMLSTYITPKELVAASNMETSVARECVAWFVARKMLVTTARGAYVKTEPGAKFLKKLVPQDFGPDLTSKEIRERHKQEGIEDEF